MALVNVIASTTFPSDGTSWTASSIPSTYDHLLLKGSIRLGINSAQNPMRVRFNSDSGANYAYRIMYQSGSSIAGYYNGGTATSIPLAYMTGNGATANCFGTFVMWMPNSGSSHYKALVSEGHPENWASAIYYPQTVSGLYESTSAINAIQVYDHNGYDILQNSSLTLYGINNAG